MASYTSLESISCMINILSRLQVQKGLPARLLIAYVLKLTEYSQVGHFSLNITNIKTTPEMYKPGMPAAFLLAVCNFKGFPALKPRQVSWAALRPAFAGLLILNMALPTSQWICFQYEIILQVHSY